MNNIDEYIALLKNANVGEGDIEKAQAVIDATDEVEKILDSSAVTLEEKKIAIAELFPNNVRKALLKISEDCNISQFDKIAKAYLNELNKLSNCAEAVITCVNEPDDEQLEGFKNFVKKETGASAVKLEIKKDASLLGGFTMRIGNKLYDRSLKTKLKDISAAVAQKAKKNNNVDAEGIISILREDIKNFEFVTDTEQIGTVISIGDGIATIEGLDSVMYGEIVIFESGVKGMVQDIKKNTVGCILFGNEDDVFEGSRVKRSYKKAGVPVGHEFLGRVINALGEPIVDRKSVSVPLETGILAIDSMFPIGRGQRELIIGDRQTGKTSIALDTIINQKGKDCICIYCAIGQKASTVSKLVSDLKKHDALDYTVVVCATAADPASLQYIAPYSATAIAEHFMYKGKDCLSTPLRTAQFRCFLKDLPEERRTPETYSIFIQDFLSVQAGSLPSSEAAQLPRSRLLKLRRATFPLISRPT